MEWVPKGGMTLNQERNLKPKVDVLATVASDLAIEGVH
jgi:hypothetical protein